LRAQNKTKSKKKERQKRTGGRFHCEVAFRWLTLLHQCDFSIFELGG